MEPGVSLGKTCRASEPEGSGEAAFRERGADHFGTACQEPDCVFEATNFQVPEALSPLSANVPSKVHWAPAKLVSILKLRFVIGQAGSLDELTLPELLEKKTRILDRPVLSGFTVKSNLPIDIAAVHSPGFGGKTGLERDWTSPPARPGCCMRADRDRGKSQRLWKVSRSWLFPP
jgi:hypothetical protein